MVTYLESPDSNLNKDQIDILFSEEKLSGLDLEEYLKLLRRVPPYFATHVTRQGLRDNFSHHMGGYGEFSNGLQEILKEGSIRSTLDQSLGGEVDDSSVSTTLQKENIGDAARLDEFVNRSVATNLASTEFADKAAVHVAIDKIASGDYGSERGNEVFIIYPMAFCASQYKIAPQFSAFPPRLKFNEVAKSSQYNDFWLLRNKDKRGVLPVNAGILFFPKSAKVDPKNGSKYEIIAGKPVENTEQIEALKRWALTLKDKFDVYALMRKFDDVQNIMGDIERVKEEIKVATSWNVYELKTKLQILVAKIESAKVEIKPALDLAAQEGVKDERFYNIFEGSNLSPWNGFRSLFYSANSDKPFSDAQRIDDMFRHMGVQFKLTENGISSEEYWKNYFVAHDLNPKVVFFEESTPDKAFEEFKRRSGLTEECGAEIDLREMYSENLIDNKKMSEDLGAERSKFTLMAKEILGL